MRGVAVWIQFEYRQQPSSKGFPFRPGRLGTRKSTICSTLALIWGLKYVVNLHEATGVHPITNHGPDAGSSLVGYCRLQINLPASFPAPCLPEGTWALAPLQ